MEKRPNFASVTDAACACGFLQRAADNPRLPIVFDPKTSEFQFHYGKAGTEMEGWITIYHCPFCGGAAPPSKRHLLFAIIPPEEEERLAELLRPVNSIRRALKRLGVPEHDDPSGMRIESWETEGTPPRKTHRRVLTYERLSNVADVRITERSDGGASWQLQGKYVGPKSDGRSPTTPAAG